MTTQKWYKYSDKTTDQTDGSNTGRHNFIRQEHQIWPFGI